MKTILHVAQSAGGVERYINTLINKMNSEKWNHILVISEDYNLNNASKIAQKVFVLPMKREIDATSDIKNIINLRKIIKKLHPDVIYLHSSKAGALGRIAAIGLRKNVIYNPHGWAFNMTMDSKRKFLYATIEKILANFCKKIITISNYEQKTALARKISSKDKIITIYNGIDVNSDSNNSSSRQHLEACELDAEKFTIGMVGRLDIQKAPDIFVKAAIEIKKIIPNAYFVMVGDGPLRNDIEKMIIENGLEKFFNITGWVSNPLDYIASFDIAMLLSRWEGFGLVITEYMYMKKPIVVTNVDAIPELIRNNETGIIVEKDNIVEVVDAVKRYYNDILFRKKVVTNAYKDVIFKYDSKRVAKEHEILFNEIISNNK